MHLSFRRLSWTHSAVPLSCVWVTAPVFVQSCLLSVSAVSEVVRACSFLLLHVTGTVLTAHARADWQSSGVLSFPREGSQIQRCHLDLSTSSHAVACVQHG